MAQLVHAEEPEEAENLPVGHAEHVLEAVAPVLTEYAPDAQAVQMIAPDKTV
jgi:hypothetical protein